MRRAVDVDAVGVARLRGGGGLGEPARQRRGAGRGVVGDDVQPLDQDLVAVAQVHRPEGRAHHVGVAQRDAGAGVQVDRVRPAVQAAVLALRALPGIAEPLPPDVAPAPDRAAPFDGDVGQPPALDQRLVAVSVPEGGQLLDEGEVVDRRLRAGRLDARDHRPLLEPQHHVGRQVEGSRGEVAGRDDAPGPGIDDVDGGR